MGSSMPPAPDPSRPLNTLAGLPGKRTRERQGARRLPTRRTLREEELPSGRGQVSPGKELQEISHRNPLRHSGRQFRTPIRPGRAERARVVIQKTDQHPPHNPTPNLAQSVTVALDLGFFQDVVPER